MESKNNPNLRLPLFSIDCFCRVTAFLSSANSWCSCRTSSDAVFTRLDAVCKYPGGVCTGGSSDCADIFFLPVTFGVCGFFMSLFSLCSFGKLQYYGIMRIL